jgi:FKBP-type peptidyl-prolyl cis-trans isomerase SlyD
MIETIHDGKYVELTYKVIDKKSGHVLTAVEFPLGYVHGHNEILSPFVHTQLEGRSAGEIIEVPIDGNRIFGARDESLVFTDRNDKGQTRSFIVTKIDDKTLTVDGNNPLCGREVVFSLAVVTVREPTDEEARAGGAIAAQADLDPSLMRPVE